MLYTTSYEPIKVWAISELKVHKKDINELGKVPSRTSCFYMFVSLPCLPEFLRWLISAEPTNHEAPLCETNRMLFQRPAGYKHGSSPATSQDEDPNMIQARTSW